jgi:hypothetical protein
VYKMTLAALLAVTPAVAQGPEAAGLASIQGAVLNERGQPVTGATAYVANRGGKQIRADTDVEGRFTLANIPLGDGEIYVNAFKESDGYPYNFFSFFMNTNRPPIKLRVEPGAVLKNVVIQLGPKAATLNLEITDQDGTPLAEGLSLTFTRADVPGVFSVGAASPHYSMLVPPVRFRFTVGATGYQSWNSEATTPSAGGSLDMVIRLNRAK